MASIIEGYTYDIFISYRQKDNKGDKWVSEFVDALKDELESTFKEEISIYFDINPHDGLLETHDVDESLKEKLKCLVFIPIISRTYCDPKSFAWEHEFKVFVDQASNDPFGLKVKLPNGNVASRVLPVQIHDLDTDDKKLVEKELGGLLRGIEFIYKSPGINRPLLPKEENPQDNLNHTNYRDQINKVANAIKEIISGLKTGQSVLSEEENQAEVLSEQNYKSIEVNDIEKVNRKPNIRSLFILTSLFLIIVSVIIYINLRDRQIGDITKLEKTIAVLPFQNDSPTEENLLYVNSFPVEIRNNLQKIENLTVIDRNSCEYINNLSLSSSEIAKKLNVNFLVQGSGFKLGNSFRLSVQLSLAAKGTVLWSNSYQIETQEVKDLFAVYLHISEAVASELEAAITPLEKKIIEKIPTKQMDAYEAYLKGQLYWRKLTPEGLDIALSFFETAKEIDPDYALAYAGISNVWIGRQQFGIESPEIAGPKANEAAMKAISLDSISAEVHYSQALIYEALKHDWESAERSYKKAIMLKPNYPEARLFYSFLLNRLGRPDEAKVQAETGIKQDPANPLILCLYAGDLATWRQYEDALNIIQKVFEIDSTSTLAFWIAGPVYFSLGNFSDAFESIKSAYSLQYSNLSHAFGEFTETTDIFNVLKKEADTLAAQRTRSYILPTDIAMLYFMSGEFNKAFDWWKIAFKEKDPNLPVALTNPSITDIFRDESRFQDLVRKLNLPFNN